MYVLFRILTLLHILVMESSQLPKEPSNIVTINMKRALVNNSDRLLYKYDAHSPLNVIASRFHSSQLENEAAKTLFELTNFTQVRLQLNRTRLDICAAMTRCSQATPFAQQRHLCALSLDMLIYLSSHAPRIETVQIVKINLIVSDGDDAIEFERARYVFDAQTERSNSGETFRHIGSVHASSLTDPESNRLIKYSLSFEDQSTNSKLTIFFWVL